MHAPTPVPNRARPWQVPLPSGIDMHLRQPHAFSSRSSRDSLSSVVQGAILQKRNASAQVTAFRHGLVR